MKAIVLSLNHIDYFASDNTAFVTDFCLSAGFHIRFPFDFEYFAKC